MCDLCRVCKKERDATYWKKYSERLIKRNRIYKYQNKDKIYKVARKYKEANREFMLWYGARKRAKKLGVEFNLEIEDIKIPKTCPLLGIKIEYNGTINNRDNSPSIDRKDISLGYVKGNVGVISYRANRIKNDATPLEIKRMAERIDNYVCFNQDNII